MPPHCRPTLTLLTDKVSDLAEINHNEVARLQEEQSSALGNVHPIPNRITPTFEEIRLAFEDMHPRSSYEDIDQMVETWKKQIHGVEIRKTVTREAVFYGSSDPVYQGPSSPGYLLETTPSPRP